MPIPIPYATDYTSTLSGSVLKFVPCEQCGTEYVYQMERTATGSGTSLLFLDNEGASERASSQAEAQLRRKLERGVDLVPCPRCGWYQQNMIPKARKQYRRWMLNTGAVLAVSLLPVGLFGAMANAGKHGPPTIPWPLFLAGLIAFALVGIGLMVAKSVLASRHDPNGQDVETRKQLGQSRAILREELEKMIKAQEEGASAQEGKASS
jgi:hypothetical protein